MIQTSSYLRREIPIALTFVLGVIVIADYFISNPTLASVTSSIRTTALLISAFAMGLGAAAILRYNFDAIVKRTPGRWPYSLTLVAVFAGGMILGLWGTTAHPTFQYWFQALYTPVSGTVYSLLGFFIISGMYRTFRARTAEAAFLLLFGAIAILRNAPLGDIYWPVFATIGNWMMDVHTTGAIRGLVISLGLGFSALGIRILLGLEKGHIGGGG